MGRETDDQPPTLHDGPATGFTQRVQAITPHQPRSAGLLDDLREILRLVFGLPCGEARSGVKIGRGRPLTSLLLGPGEAGGSSDAGSRAVGPSVSP